MGSTVSPSMTITGNIAGPPIHLIHIDTKGSEPPLLHPPQAQVRWLDDCLAYFTTIWMAFDLFWTSWAECFLIFIHRQIFKAINGKPGEQAELLQSSSLNLTVLIISASDLVDLQEVNPSNSWEKKHMNSFDKFKVCYRDHKYTLYDCKWPNKIYIFPTNIKMLERTDSVHNG